jgi:catalase-peroxidase
MLTTDLALKEDPEFRKIAERFMKNPKEFDLAFAKAWFKLTHRDLGPRTRYLGSEIPEEVFVWQDPVPAASYKVSVEDASDLKAKILESGLTVPELVKTAWASASTYRGSDMRGGANGARVQLAPQKDWEANDPAELANVLSKLEKVKQDAASKVSMADLIVLGGVAAIEKAAKDAGYDITVPFTPGRGDATQDMTDIQSFAVLEPKADAFRNYYNEGAYGSPANMLVEKADLLGLTVPEVAALVGGMRALSANTGGSMQGVFTDKPGQLSNDFFTNLLDMSTTWAPSDKEGVYEGRDRASGDLKWTATPVDLVFGSNSELRAVTEVYASEDGEQKFIDDFVKAWSKVMNNGRFDI